MGKLTGHIGTSSLSHSDAAVPTSTSRNPFRRAKNALSGSNQQSLGTDNYQQQTMPSPAYSEQKLSAYVPHMEDPVASTSQSSQYAPPPGPPPSQYAPPPGPPPTYDTKINYNEKSDVEPPPYDPWLSVPDSSMLPPPPSLSNEFSPTSNASTDKADAAREWSRYNPLAHPRRFGRAELDQIYAGQQTLTKPNNTRTQLHSTGPGTWRVSTPRGAEDTVLLTALPMYAAGHHDPRSTGRSFTAYFEVRVVNLDLSSSPDGEVSSAVAVGFLAPPYPAWRMPGWERASLGVHSDDGRRYVNNNQGGVDFTTFFSHGEVVGIGMAWEDARGHPVGGIQGRNNVKVFFTRDGRKVGGWDLWEERDAGDEEGDPAGLGGERDVCGAIGLFGQAEIEFRARRDEWLYRPDLH